MNRRFFLNTLGKAILGTAIVLNLPDILVPTIKEEIECMPPISWSVMDKMYRKMIEGNSHPSMMYVSDEGYEFLMSNYGEQL